MPDVESYHLLSHIQLKASSGCFLNNKACIFNMVQIFMTDLLVSISPPGLGISACEANASLHYSTSNLFTYAATLERVHEKQRLVNVLHSR